MGAQSEDSTDMGTTRVHDGISIPDRWWTWALVRHVQETSRHRWDRGGEAEAW